jgi:predicted CXXCH cytochrome family protein
MRSHLDIFALTKLLVIVLLVSLVLISSPLNTEATADPQSGNQRAGKATERKQKQLDPAAWGSNHVGKPIPDFVRGDECLFCHRNDIGPTWQKNAHGITIRTREDAPELEALLEQQGPLSAFKSEIEYFLGSRHYVRFLKKVGYGKFALLSARADLDDNKRASRWVNIEKLQWDQERFANRCAGCHTTAVEAKTKAFSAFGLDCYTCHGNVSLDHTKDTSLVWLSKKNRSDSRAITSICAQCHLRMGRSKSTGLPYPNNFVAGDNLFQDYRVDFSKADDESLNPADRHILRNVRDVVLYGKLEQTCLSCHQLHLSSTMRHRRQLKTAICSDCHEAEGPMKNIRPYTVHSDLCEY